MRISSKDHRKCMNYVIRLHKNCEFHLIIVVKAQILSKGHVKNTNFDKGCIKVQFSPKVDRKCINFVIKSPKHVNFVKILL